MEINIPTEKLYATVHSGGKKYICISETNTTINSWKLRSTNVVDAYWEMEIFTPQIKGLVKFDDIFYKTKISFFS